MTRRVLVVACLVAGCMFSGLLGACTISGLEETATQQVWPMDVEGTFGCTPVSLDFFGGGIRGSGSGVFVSDRWLLTAAHVVPSDAQYVWIWRNDDASPLGMVMPIELIVSGGGKPVEAGDWALVRVPRHAGRMGVQHARLVSRMSDAPGLLVGFPTMGDVQADLFSPRQMVVLESEAPSAGFFDDDSDLRYFRMVRGWSALGGASGGPVIVRDAQGRPAVGGIVLGRVEYRGLWRRGRAIVAHAIPPQAMLAARGMLDDLPSRDGADVLLVGSGGDGGGATGPSYAEGDGNGISQRQAASRR